MHRVAEETIEGHEEILPALDGTYGIIDGKLGEIEARLSEETKKYEDSIREKEGQKAENEEKIGELKELYNERKLRREELDEAIKALEEEMHIQERDIAERNSAINTSTVEKEKSEYRVALLTELCEKEEAKTHLMSNVRESYTYLFKFYKDLMMHHTQYASNIGARLSEVLGSIGADGKPPVSSEELAAEFASLKEEYEKGLTMYEDGIRDKVGFLKSDMDELASMDAGIEVVRAKLVHKKEEPPEKKKEKGRSKLLVPFDFIGGVLTSPIACFTLPSTMEGVYDDALRGKNLSIYTGNAVGVPLVAVAALKSYYYLSGLSPWAATAAAAGVGLIALCTNTASLIGLPRERLERKCKESFDKGEFDELLEASEKLIDKNKKSVTAWNYHADALYNLGRYCEAEGSYYEILRLDSKAHHAWDNLARIEIRRNEYSAALKDNVEAALIKDSYTRNVLGLLDEHIGNIDEDSLIFAMDKLYENEKWELLADVSHRVFDRYPTAVEKFCGGGLGGLMRPTDNRLEDVVLNLLKRYPRHEGALNSMVLALEKRELFLTALAGCELILKENPSDKATKMRKENLENGLFFLAGMNMGYSGDKPGFLSKLNDEVERHIEGKDADLDFEARLLEEYRKVKARGKEQRKVDDLKEETIAPFTGVLEAIDDSDEDLLVSLMDELYQLEEWELLADASQQVLDRYPTVIEKFCEGDDEKLVRMEYVIRELAKKEPVHDLLKKNTEDGGPELSYVISLRRKGLPLLALAECERALRKNPDNSGLKTYKEKVLEEVLYNHAGINIGYSHDKPGFLSKLNDEVERRIEGKDVDLDFNARLLEEYRKTDKSDVYVAEEFHIRMIVMPPWKDEDSLVSLMDELYENEKWELLADVSHSVFDRYPTAIEKFCEAGLSTHRGKRLKDVVHNLLKKYPKDRDALDYMMRTFKKEGLFFTALAECNRILRENPSNQEVKMQKEELEDTLFILAGIDIGYSDDKPGFLSKLNDEVERRIEGKDVDLDFEARLLEKYREAIARGMERAEKKAAAKKKPAKKKIVQDKIRKVPAELDDLLESAKSTYPVKDEELEHIDDSDEDSLLSAMDKLYENEKWELLADVSYRVLDTHPDVLEKFWEGDVEKFLRIRDVVLDLLKKELKAGGPELSYAISLRGEDIYLLALTDYERELRENPDNEEFKRYKRQVEDILYSHAGINIGYSDDKPGFLSKLNDEVERLIEGKDVDLDFDERLLEEYRKVKTRGRERAEEKAVPKKRPSKKTAKKPAKKKAVRSKKKKRKRKRERKVNA